VLAADASQEEARETALNDEKLKAVIGRKEASSRSFMCRDVF
jgi:hypothetical protein